ncbi:unnamed protein product [Fraxinus pennsylvanica]|uniref:Uncharacterized protein n=1 Tax=Fraxinus pennsylvanica TaxID=56036 RepID=A0AAD2A0Q2_9LAMI|nr:unnamed protein product [Fraxinus pennsylvanica]
MVISGRCHREKKISCSKNLSAVLHSTSSRFRVLQNFVVYCTFLVDDFVTPLHVLDIWRSCDDFFLQLASFMKTRIFSQRRPIDGWKYMIEEIGPNAKRSNGSLSRLPSVSDEINYTSY